MTIKTADIWRLYLFGSSKSPQKEEPFQIQRYYSKSELDELELDSDSIHASQKPQKNILNYLNTDWDTGRGSLRNSEIGLFDAFFSSLGNGISALCPDYLKIALSIKVVLTSLLMDNKFDFMKHKISINNFAGRLIRSPLHIFDSFFSVTGQTLSKMPFFTPLGFLISGFGLFNSFKNKNNNIFSTEIHYDNFIGTILRTTIHQFSSSITNNINNCLKKNFLLNIILASLSVIGIKLIPKDFKNHKINWKSLDGLLAQNLFHANDAIFASLGTNIFKRIGDSWIGLASIFTSGLGLSLLPGFIESDKLNKFLNSELIFTRVDSKLIRDVNHSLY